MTLFALAQACQPPSDRWMGAPHQGDVPPRIQIDTAILEMLYRAEEAELDTSVIRSVVGDSFVTWSRDMRPGLNGTWRYGLITVRPLGSHARQSGLTHEYGHGYYHRHDGDSDGDHSNDTWWVFDGQTPVFCRGD